MREREVCVRDASRQVILIKISSDMWRHILLLHILNRCGIYSFFIMRIMKYFAERRLDFILINLHMKIVSKDSKTTKDYSLNLITGKSSYNHLLIYGQDMKSMNGLTQIWWGLAYGSVLMKGNQLKLTSQIIFCI